jgi:hypothetical protein
MLYAVSAKLILDRAPEFHTRLTDGSIAAQRPDGAEIVAASHPGTQHSMSDYVISAGCQVEISRPNTGLQTTNGSDCCHWPAI